MVKINKNKAKAVPAVVAKQSITKPKKENKFKKAQGKDVEKTKKLETALNGIEKKSLEIPDKKNLEDQVVMPEADVILSAIDGAKKGVEKENQESVSKGLFDDELSYGLQVIMTKIPVIPPHTKKISLKHSLLTEPIDIAFIIKDILPKTEENSKLAISKMQELLKECGVEDVKTIMTFSQVKADYGPHNMKLKLLHTYDLFLVESEIAEHTYSILGKHFIRKRKRPLQIDTSNKEYLKTSIDNAKLKVSFKLGPHSNLTIIDVGTHKMDNNKILDNIQTTIEQLKEKLPGGLTNIKKLYFKPMKVSKVILPLYYSKIDPNDLEVPIEKGSKQKRLEKVSRKMDNISKRVKLDIKKKKMIRLKPDQLEKGKKRPGSENDAQQTSPKKVKSNVPEANGNVNVPNGNKVAKTLTEKKENVLPQKGGKKNKNKKPANITKPEIVTKSVEIVKVKVDPKAEKKSAEVTKVKVDKVETVIAAKKDNIENELPQKQGGKKNKNKKNKNKNQNQSETTTKAENVQQPKKDTIKNKNLEQKPKAIGGKPTVDGKPKANGKPIVNGKPQLNGKPQVSAKPVVDGKPQLNGKQAQNGKPNNNKNKNKQKKGKIIPSK